jgi:hypothetical protein
MKQVFKYMMAAMVVVATFGLTGCNKDKEDTKPTVTPEHEQPAASVVFRLNSSDGPAIAAGDTVRYTTTDVDMNGLHYHAAAFFIDNKTADSYAFNRSLEVMQGPADLEVNECLDVCYPGLIPAEKLPYNIASGVCQEYSIHTILKPEYSGQQVLYKVTLGMGQRLESPVTFYLLVNVL